MAKGQVGSDEGSVPKKHIKVGKKATETNTTSPTLVMALPTAKFDPNLNQTITSGTKNKPIESRSAVHQSHVVSNGEPITDEKGEKQKAGVLPSKYHGSKLKEGNQISDTLNQRSNEKILYAQCKSKSARPLSIGEDLGQSFKQREKNGIRERSDAIVLEGGNSMQTMVSRFLRFRLSYLHVFYQLLKYIGLVFVVPLQLNVCLE